MSDMEQLYGTPDWPGAAWREIREDVNLTFRQLERRARTAVAELEARFDKAILSGEGFSPTSGEIEALAVKYILATVEAIAATEGVSR